MVDAWQPSLRRDARADRRRRKRVMDTDALRSARAVRQPVRSTERSHGGLRRHHLRQGRRGAADDRELARPGHVPARRAALPPRQRLEERARRRSLQARSTSSRRRRSATWRAASSTSPACRRCCSAGSAAAQGGQPSSSASRSGARSAARDEQPRKWTLPVCVAGDPDGQKSKSCFTLGAEPITRDLGALPGVALPERRAGRVLPLRPRQARSSSRSRASERGARSRRPARPRLERLGGGAAGRDRAGHAARRAAAVRRREPTASSSSRSRRVSRASTDALVDDDDRAAFQRYVAARMAGRKAALGWEPRGKRGRRPRARAPHRALHDGRARLRPGTRSPRPRRSPSGG